MRKLLLLLCLVFSTTVFADTTQLNLETEHGENLDKAMFPIRYQFQKTSGLSWKDSSVEERRVFLERYYAELASDAKSKRTFEKVERQKQRALEQEKRQAEREEKERLKSRAQEKKEEEKLNENEKKRFNEYVKRKQKEMDQLRKSQKSSRH